MLVEARKFYSHIMSLNRVGPSPKILSLHYVTIVRGRWREWGGVQCWHDILLGCGRSYSVQGVM